jgi:hypothetical protein
VRFDHVASFIVNANHGIVSGRKICAADCIATELNLQFRYDCLGFVIRNPFATEPNIKELHHLCLTIQKRKKKKTRSHRKISKFRLSQNRLLVPSPVPRLAVSQDRSALLSAEWWVRLPEKPPRSDARSLEQQGGLSGAS